jgi:hypothetical protein
MFKRTTLMTAALALLLTLPLIQGCGGGDTAQQAESAAPAEQTTTEQPAAETPAAEAGEQVATHDCAGGCGMTNWPEDQMTEIDGKWYCAGCAKKVQETHDHDGHEGHSH